MWNDAVVTNIGRELLAQWVSGSALTVTDAAVGEGSVAASLLMAQTNLKNRKQTLSIVKSEAVEGGRRLQLQLTSIGVTTGYTINQIGIWAKLEGGADQMIAIYQDDTGISVPTEAEMPDYVFTFYATIQMSNTGAFSVTLDTSALVTRADFNAESAVRQAAELALDEKIDEKDEAQTEALSEHTERTDNPHAVTQNQLLDGIEESNDLNADDLLLYQDAADDTAKKISKTNLREALGLNTVSMKDAVITLGSTPTYTGSEQTQTVSSVKLGGTTLVVGTDYIVSGNTGTNAGDYTLVVTGLGRYVGSVAKTWKINKAAGSASAASSSLNILGVVGTSKTNTITRSGDGAVIAYSDKPDIATVTVSGTTVTVRLVGAGSATVSVTVAPGTNHEAASCTFTVSTTLVSTTLNDNSWALIKQVSDNDAGAAIWSVGATKSVLINGTVGTLSINTTLWVYILGFNHNQNREGAHKIHFGGFKTAQSGGIDVALIDSKYGNGAADGTKYFNMNHWGNSNLGGWKGCDLRYDVLGSTNQAPSGYGSAKSSSTVGYDAGTTTATSPVSGTLMAALPSDLRAVMKPITKYSDNKGGGSDTASYVSASVDYLPLLAEFEIFGTRSYANSSEKNYQAQYTYYANGNSKKKYRHSATSSSSYWWERSVSASNSNSFCTVNTSGSASGNGAAGGSGGLSPAFAV